MRAVRLLPDGNAVISPAWYNAAMPVGRESWTLERVIAELQALHAGSSHATLRGARDICRFLTRR